MCKGCSCARADALHVVQRGAEAGEGNPCGDPTPLSLAVRVTNEQDHVCTHLHGHRLAAVLQHPNLLSIKKGCHGPLPHPDQVFTLQGSYSSWSGLGFLSLL